MFLTVLCDVCFSASIDMLLPGTLSRPQAKWDVRSAAEQPVLRRRRERLQLGHSQIRTGLHVWMPPTGRNGLHAGTSVSLTHIIFEMLIWFVSAVQGLLGAARGAQEHPVLLQGGHVQSIFGSRVPTHAPRAQLDGRPAHDQLRAVHDYFPCHLRAHPRPCLH